MAKIKSFTKPQCVVAREELNKALKVIEERLGVKVTVGNCKYSADNAEFKVSLSVIGEGGVAQTREVQDWKFYAEGEGLPVDLLGKTIKVAGNTYRICGFLPKKQKYPVLAAKNGAETPSTVISVDMVKHAVAAGAIVQ